MRILQASFSPLGGAGRVARNTAKLLRAHTDHDVENFFVHRSNIRQDPLSVPSITASSLFDEYVVKRSDEKSMVSLLRSKGSALFPSAGYDIIHLHWWQDFDLEKLAFQNSSAKFVLTLHDDRAFTGACHSSGACEQHESGCKACPIVRAPFRPLVRREYVRARELLSNLPSVCFVAPSKGILETAKNSGLDEIGDIAFIPNPISEAFAELDESQIGTRAKEDDEIINVGFIAENLDDSNKRLYLAIDLVRRLRSSGMNLMIQVVGRSSNKFKENWIDHRGTLAPEQIVELSRAWAALIVSSEFENAPLIIAEVGMLGVPTISDSSGGMGEILQLTGQSPMIEDWDSLSENETLEIGKFISGENNQLGGSIRAASRKNFGFDSIVGKLLEVYSTSNERS